MRALILAAGEGQHFHPLTRHRPKAMVCAASKPLLQHVVEALAAAGVKDVGFVEGYHAERVRTFFGDGLRLGITAHYASQPEPTGTGDALWAGRDLVAGHSEFLCVFGDGLYDPTLIRRVLQTPGDVVAAMPSERAHRYGRLLVRRDELESVEYPAATGQGLVNVGVMKFTRDFLAFLGRLAPEERRQLPTALNAYARSGAQVHVPTVQSGWEDAPEAWDLLRLNEILLNRIPKDKAVLIPNAVVNGPVEIGAGTRIQPGAILQGPVVLGENCEIREGAVIGPYAAIRNNVHVGAHSVVRNAIINNNVFLDDHCVLRFSILDDGVQVGAFCLLEDGTAPHEPLAGRRIGSIVGADAVLQPRTTLAPGTVVEPEGEPNPPAGEALRVRVA